MERIDGVATQISPERNGSLTDAERNELRDCISTALTGQLTAAQLNNWRFLPATYHPMDGPRELLFVFDRRTMMVYRPDGLKQVIDLSNGTVTTSTEPS